jgi:hypothetical protein
MGAARTCARRRLTRLRCTAACKFLLIPKITPVSTPARCVLARPTIVVRPMRRRARESRDRRNRHPHFDSRIRATRCSCTAPCKEQAGNREPSSAPIFYTRTLLLRSDQPRRLRWVRFAKCAARAFAPSPLAGEGTMVFPLTRMGEGFPSSTHPSPIIARGSTEQPSPARGEGTVTFTEPRRVRTTTDSISRCQTASLLRSRGAFLRPGFCILASPSPDRGVAERRETFGCSGTRWACAHASRRA